MHLGTLPCWAHPSLMDMGGRWPRQGLLGRWGQEQLSCLTLAAGFPGFCFPGLKGWKEPARESSEQSGCVWGLSSFLQVYITCHFPHGPAPPDLITRMTRPPCLSRDPAPTKAPGLPPPLWGLRPTACLHSRRQAGGLAVRFGLPSFSSAHLSPPTLICPSKDPSPTLTGG